MLSEARARTRTRWSRACLGVSVCALGQNQTHRLIPGGSSRLTSSGVVERQLERPSLRVSAPGKGIANGASGLAPAAPYPKLRPRPHGATREEVCSNQRARLCAAMVELVAVNGYGAITVADLCALAGVSKRTLYERFAGKQDCFLAAFEMVVSRAARRIVAAQDGERDWRARLCRAFAAFAQEVANDPRGARLVLVEAFGAGPAALERMERTSALLEGVVSASFDQATEDLSVGPIVVKGIVAGVARVARVRLMDDRQQELPGLAGELSEWMLSYRSPAAARLDGLPRATVSMRPATMALAPEGEELSREDDRARILSATAELAAERGYGQLSIEQIVAGTGVSARIFFGLFDGVEQCFLAALELLSRHALALAGRAGSAGEDWPRGVYRAVVALTDHIVRDAVFQRVAFVEVFALGPAGLRLREGLMASCAAGLRASAPSECQPSELVLQASLGAVWGIIHHYVARGRARRLPALAGQLAYVLLAPIVGANTAVQGILDEHARLCVLSRGGGEESPPGG
jgi:AcrR family transcriptional regulator